VVLALTALLSGLLTLLAPTAHAAGIKVTATVVDAPRYGDATMSISVASTGVDPYAWVRIGGAVVVEGPVSAEPTELIVPLPGDGTDVGATYKLDIAVEADGGYSASTSLTTTRTTIPYVIEAVGRSSVHYGEPVVLRLVPTRPTPVAPQGRIHLLQNESSVSSGQLAPAADGRGYVATVRVMLAPRTEPYSVRGSIDGFAGYASDPDAAQASQLTVTPVPSKTTAKLSSAAVVAGKPVKLHVTVTAPGSGLSDAELGSTFVTVSVHDGTALLDRREVVVPVGLAGVDMDLTDFARTHTGVFTVMATSVGGHLTTSFAENSTLSVQPVPSSTSTSLSLDHPTTYVGDAPARGVVTVDVADGGTPDGLIELSTADQGRLLQVRATGATTPVALPTLAEGAYVVKARYLGGTGQEASDSSTLTYTVARDAVQWSDDLPADGTVAATDTVRVTLAPTHTERTPTGRLRVEAAGWDGVAVDLVDGVASVPLAGLAAGSHELVLSYLGDTYFQELQDSRVVTVRGTEPPPGAAVTTSTGLSLDRALVPAGSAATATVRVASADGSSPVGQVEVRIDGTVVATRLTGSAPFQVALPPVAVGAHTVTARFAGAGSYVDSAAPAATLTVTRAAATISAKAKRRSDGRAQVRVTVSAPVPATGTVQLWVAKGGKLKAVATATLADGRGVLRSRRPLPARAALVVRYVGSAVVEAAERRLRLR
jgi:hypothetical protein